MGGMDHDKDIPHADLLAEIRHWCAAREMPLTRFGMDALRDPSFVRGLESGRECRRATLAKVRAFMASSDQPVRAAE